MKKAKEVLALFENNGEPVILPVSEAEPRRRKRRLHKYTNIGGWLPFGIGLHIDNDPHEDEPGHPDGDNDTDDQPAAPAAPAGPVSESDVKDLISYARGIVHAEIEVLEEEGMTKDEFYSYLKAYRKLAALPRAESDKLYDECGFKPKTKNEDDPMIGEEDELSTSRDPLMEGAHYNTRIRQLEARSHPVKVRLGIKECHRMVEEMLDPSHPSPNPVDEPSRKLLEGVSRKLGSIREAMKHVDVRKRVKR